MLNPLLGESIKEKIRAAGGWVNAHAHLDRAYSITPETFALMNKLRSEKWKLNKQLRITSTVSDVYDRMAKGTETLLSQGCFATATFIDVDEDIKDKAIKAAQKIRSTYKEMTFRFMNQSSYGVLNKKGREWFDVGSQFVDIIGGTLKTDKGREHEHIDVLFSTAKSMGKMVHIHIDEENTPEEKETEMVIKKMVEHSMQGKVVGIHGISINAHQKSYRKKLYGMIKEAGLMFVACPMSWINARRSETLTPTHNPITPLDEMYPYGITVALGVDNIADIFMAFNDGNLWNDLRLLMECNRFYDIDALVDIATKNGRTALGIR